MKTLQEKKDIMAREAMFVKGFIHGMKLKESMRAFTLMMRYHEGVVRKSGLDYTTHPVRVAHQLLASGVSDDHIIAAALLHDVVEDCPITLSDLTEFTIPTCDIISLVTKVDSDLDRYYREISTDVGAMLVKISDRLHNLSTMHGAFSKVKMLDYVEETYKYIIPMCKTLKYNYPEYSSVSYTMKNQMETICEIYLSLITLEKEEEK